ncbi:unnamed protein product [Larinioides sclopetarius]|uniref:Uncharacterized protein n=1 Tax=Larinioides sclopetarius TaxID=280406 RepID=A0AAV2A410_9ARAC
MASTAFFVITTCCFFGLVINQNWSREHRVDHQLHRVPRWEPLHYLTNRNMNGHGTSNDHHLLMDASKRGVILFRHRDDDSMSRMFRGRMNKVRKLSQMSRPRGHPLRWG